MRAGAASWALPRQAEQEVALQALSGKLERPNGNGGRTIGDAYYPPPEGEAAG